EGAGRGSKTLFLWLLRSGSSIVSIPQKACSALLRGFESRNRDWESKISGFLFIMRKAGIVLGKGSGKKHQAGCAQNHH
ncbi:MAG: hypothetical protein MR424_02560, partial [Treponema sp.]|nr:hypothetical protein [Treponema sp.]MCI6893059.1 hypothetical protein [Treponema sp.]